MNIQEFINKCHAVQHDAGGPEHFNTVMGKAVEVCLDENLNDPVAAFLGALIANEGGDIKAAIGAMPFWVGELTRVFEGVKEK